MMIKRFWWAVRIGVVILASCVTANAQATSPVNLSGFIHDYTAANLGSWEVTGEWMLTLKGESGFADFSAAFTMLHSDYWLFTTGADPDNPTARTPHTHHVTLVDGVVTSIPNGFRVTGPITITANGNPVPFGSSSTIQVDVTGGSSLTVSNIKVTFGGDAASHFGTQPLDGVVRQWR